MKFFQSRQKQIIFASLIICMSFSFFGCNRSEEPPGTSTEPVHLSGSDITTTPEESTAPDSLPTDTDAYFTTKDGVTLPVISSTSTDTLDVSSSPPITVPTTTSLFPLSGISSDNVYLSKSAGNSIIASASISVPIFANPSGSTVIDAINEKISDILKEQKAYFNDTLIPSAQEAYDNGALNFEYAVTMEYEITLNSRTMLSIVFFVEIIDGGTHPYDEKFTLNFNLVNGKVLSLSSMFNVSSETYMTIFYNYMLNIMKTDGVSYYPDYINLMRRAKLENRWYFNTSGLVFIYGLYEIAPYIEGILTYTIPYSEINTILAFNPTY